MKNNLHVFLGATVADAAARPLHWVYDQKKLLTYIKGKKDFTFLKKNKSPFYIIKTGKVSGYNDVGQVMFKTLIEGHEATLKRFRRHGSSIALEPANSAYETRVIPDNLIEIQGRLVGLIRSY